MALGTLPQHYTSSTYAQYNNTVTEQLAKTQRRELDSGGNATRDMGVSDPRGFEGNQVLLRENQEHIKTNALAVVEVKNMVSDIEVFEQMARNFQSSLSEIRTSGPFTNPAFTQNLTDNLASIARIYNKSANGFYQYGFSNGNSTVVNQAMMTTALPAGSTQDLSYLQADLNGKLTYRTSNTSITEVDGFIFHTVMEKFVRAQRMALSGDFSASDRTQDPALSSATDLISQALDDLQGLKFIFASAAGKFDNDTNLLKDQNIPIAEAIQNLGYLDPRTAMQQQFEMKTLLDIQNSTYVMATKQSQRLVDSLSNIAN